MGTIASIILKAIISLVIIVPLLALIRAIVRVFYKSQILSIGVAISLVIGGSYYICSGVMFISAFLGVASFVFLFITWLTVSYVNDRKAWKESAGKDNYQSYSSYLRSDKPKFHTSKATINLRRCLKEQIAFFVIISKRSDSNLSEVPYELARIVADFDIRKKIPLYLVVSSNMGKLFEEYEMSKIKEVKALDDYEYYKEMIDNPDEDLYSDAKEQLSMKKHYEKVLASLSRELDIYKKNPLIDPRPELTVKAMVTIEKRLQKVISKAFSLILPPELLQVLLPKKEYLKTHSAIFSEHCLKVHYTAKPLDIGYLVVKSTPEKYYSYNTFEIEWDTQYKSHEKIISDKFVTKRPAVYSNRLGIKRTYSYLIARAYSDYAWELLKKMGFVHKENFDDIPNEDQEIEVSDKDIFSEVYDEFKKEVDNVLENELMNLASHGMFALWLQSHEEEMHKVSMQIENELANDLKNFFEESLSLLEAIIVVPDISFFPEE